jgi:hypothetical protein
MPPHLIVMEPQFWNVGSLYLCKADAVTLVVGAREIRGETPNGRAGPVSSCGAPG